MFLHSEYVLQLAFLHLTVCLGNLSIAIIELPLLSVVLSSILLMLYYLFTYSLINRHSGCFVFFILMISATVNIILHNSLCTYLIIFPCMMKRDCCFKGYACFKFILILIHYPPKRRY